MESPNYKFGVFYTDGGWRERDGSSGGGLGIHGYMFNEITAPRISKVPALITPFGYVPKMSGAQIKDEAYNPEYSAWGHTVNAKDGTLKDVQDIKLIDIRKGNGNETAQRCELSAFIDVFSHDEIKCDKYTIHSDSAYLVDGVHKYLEGWKSRKWTRSNGMPVLNPELWISIDKIMQEKGGDIDLRKIKAHNGHHGNEFADRNATHGVALALKNMNITEAVVSEVHDTNYWEANRNIPIMLKQRWCYGMSDSVRETVEFDGTDLIKYFMGSHNDSKDNIELLGMEMSTAGFSVVLSKDTFPVIDEIKDHHVQRMWPNKNIMHQSEHMIMVNLDGVDTGSAAWEISHIGLDGAVLTNSLNDLVLLDADELLLSKVLRPARLSFRVLEVESIMMDVLKSYASHKNVTFNGAVNKMPLDARFTDVTDKFYQEVPSGKSTKPKLSDNFGMLVRSLSFDVANPCSSKLCKVIFSTDIDLPARTIMANIAHANPKVTVATWMFDGIMCNFGLIVDCDLGLGIWSGYASTRILNYDEQDSPK